MYYAAVYPSGPVEAFQDAGRAGQSARAARRGGVLHDAHRESGRGPQAPWLHTGQLIRFKSGADIF